MIQLGVDYLCIITGDTYVPEKVENDIVIGTSYSAFGTERVFAMTVALFNEHMRLC